MEKAGYREALELLTIRTSKIWLTAVDVATLLEMDRDTVKRKFGITSKGIAITELARKLVETR